MHPTQSGPRKKKDLRKIENIRKTQALRLGQYFLFFPLRFFWAVFLACFYVAHFLGRFKGLNYLFSSVGQMNGLNYLGVLPPKDRIGSTHQTKHPNNSYTCAGANSSIISSSIKQSFAPFVINNKKNN